MHTHTRSFARSSSLALVALVGAGCHGSSDDAHHEHAIPVYSEVESNDDAFTANDFGFLRAGDELRVEGSVRDDAFDPQDGFAFTALGAIHVEFVLDADCACNDLDVWVYDPLIGEFVGVFDAPTDPERGSLTVFGQAFHLVVVSASGDAFYRLDLRTSPVYAAAATDGDANSILVNASRPSTPLARTPSPELRAYAARARKQGPPRLAEVFVIDPDVGVLGSVLMPPPN